METKKTLWIWKGVDNGRNRPNLEQGAISMEEPPPAIGVHMWRGGKKSAAKRKNTDAEDDFLVKKFNAIEKLKEES